MRLRLPELLDAAGLTAYALAKRSAGRISLSTAYRLCRLEGRLESFEARALEALCDVLDVEPGALFARDPVPAKGRGVAKPTKSATNAKRGRRSS